MIGLATAALLDAGVRDSRPHLFVAHAEHIATLVLSKSPFTDEQLKFSTTRSNGSDFNVLLAPDQPPESAAAGGHDRQQGHRQSERGGVSALLDLTVPTDNRPFFFNQLRFSSIPQVLMDVAAGRTSAGISRATCWPLSRWR